MLMRQAGKKNTKSLTRHVFVLLTILFSTSKEEDSDSDSSSGNGQGNSVGVILGRAVEMLADNLYSKGVHPRWRSRTATHVAMFEAATP
jgi:hypothetical protein